MKFYCLICLILIASPGLIFAQVEERKTWIASLFHDYFPFDSSYVSSYPTKPLLKFVLNNKSHDFYIRSTNSNTIHYKPGRANGYGFGLVYHQLAMELSFTPPQKFDINHASPNGRIDINTTLFNNRFGLDLLFQNYRGYVLSRPEQIIRNWDGQSYIRNDLASTFIGINFFYVQNAKKYSLRSAFVGDQIQHKSSGSLLYGAYLNTLNIQGKTNIVSDSAQTFNEDVIGVKRISNISLGFMMGFGYNIVLPKGFFIGLVAIPGMGLAVGGKSQNRNLPPEPQLFPQVMINARASFGFNHTKWYTSLQWSENLGAYEFGSESRVSINQSKLKATFGYRFQKSLKYKNKLL